MNIYTGFERATKFVLNKVIDGVLFTFNYFITDSIEGNQSLTVDELMAISESDYNDRISNIFTFIKKTHFDFNENSDLINSGRTTSNSCTAPTTTAYIPTTTIYTPTTTYSDHSILKIYDILYDRVIFNGDTINIDSPKMLLLINYGDTDVNISDITTTGDFSNSLNVPLTIPVAQNSATTITYTGDIYTNNFGVLKIVSSSETINIVLSYNNIPTTIYVPTTTAYVPTTTVYVLTTTGYIATTTAYVPTTTAYVPTTTEYIVTTTVYVPTTTAYVPTTTEYVPTTTILGQTTTVYVPTTTVYVPTTTYSNQPPVALNYTKYIYRSVGFCSDANASSNPTNAWFPYTDTESDTMNAVQITSLPTNGTLTKGYFGTININDILNYPSDFSSLIYYHSTGGITSAYDDYVGFRVRTNNNGSFSNEATLTFSVSACVAATTAYVPTTTVYVPTTTVYVPTTTVYVPTTTAYVPTTTAYVPTTTVAGTKPTVTTNTITSIGTTTATGGGNVTAQGSTAVTARGVCWKANATPFITDSTSSNGTGTGAFTSSLIGLTQNEAYYVRAYATNSAGTSYGAVEIFITESAAPVVSTSAASSVGTTTATANGSVTTLGNSGLQVKGFCWSTSTAYPTTGDTHSNNGNFASGAFSHDITGLAANTLYYVRAYSHNDRGYFYGNTLSFTTSPTTTAYVPTTTTTAPEFSNYLVTSYDCNDCSIIDSNFLVTDYRSDLIFHRYYTDMLSGLTYRIIQTNASSGGISSNMTGSGVVTCAELNCI